MKGQLNSRFIEDLDPESHSLPLLHDGFGYHFRFEDSPIISVYETMETKTVVVSTQISILIRYLILTMSYFRSLPERDFGKGLVQWS